MEAERTSAAGGRVARVPKYYGLKRHLVEFAQTHPPGSPVPPERTLATEFDTSRTTVRQALHELVIEGRLERIQGKGTFIAKPKVAQTLQLSSYTEDMRAHGLEPASRLLDVAEVPADGALADRLALIPGAPITRVERLRMADEDPMAIETTHLSAERFPDLQRHVEDCFSLYAILAQRYGVHLADGDETIETALATPREAALLRTDVGLPMLLLSRHSRDAAGQPVEWAKAVYRGDRYKFVARLRRPDSS